MYLASMGLNQIAVIRALRQHLSLDLGAAKNLTDVAKRGEHSSLNQSMPSPTAMALGNEAKRAGGRVEFR